MIKLNKQKQIELEVYIQPQASKNEIIGEHNGALKVKINAPPVDGAANAELIHFLSKYLKIAKRNITLVRGETNRHKLLQIDGLTLEELKSKLGLE